MYGFDRDGAPSLGKREIGEVKSPSLIPWCYGLLEIAVLSSLAVGKLAGISCAGIGLV
jgi:hypothetical protein